MAPAWFAATASGLMIAKVFSILKSALDRFADGGRRGAHGDAGVFHRGDFVLGLATASGNDRACVTHAAAGRSGLACDESYDRLFHVGLDVRGGGLLRAASDFAYHDDGVRVGILVKEANRVGEGGADDRVASDAYAGGLADAELGELTDRFIRQRAGPGDDADVPFLMNVRGHDSDFAFAGRNDTGAIRTDEARRGVVFQVRPRANHILGGDALGDADDQRGLG